MGKWAQLGITALVALVFGFLGALVAVDVEHDALRGPQGASGLAGPPGARGPAGLDGADGVDGARGPAGKAGKAARRVSTDLGTSGCAGSAQQVVTDVTVVGKKMHVTKADVCVVR